MLSPPTTVALDACARSSHGGRRYQAQRLGPGGDFWRSLRHREEAPPDGLSACETFRACPDCDGDVGVVEDAPSDASSDVDLLPLGGASNDDDSD